MIYILDTDILSLLGHKNSPEAPRIRRRIAQLPAQDAVVTTAINFEEQMRGWIAELGHTHSFKSEIRVYARLLDHLESFRRMTVLGFDEAAAMFAQQHRNRRLGSMDLKIGAIALAHDAVVVTRNFVDFRKIPGLRIEDWTMEVDS